MTLDSAQDALAAFTGAGDWESRSRLLLQWGSHLEPLEQHREDDLVQGCTSQVWLVHERNGANNHFIVDSGSRVLKGLLAVVLARVNGLDNHALAEVDVEQWLQSLGLERQLTPSRSNGLRAVLVRMRELAGINPA